MPKNLVTKRKDGVVYQLTYAQISLLQQLNDWGSVAIVANKLKKSRGYLDHQTKILAEAFFITGRENRLNRILEQARFIGFLES